MLSIDSLQDRVRKDERRLRLRVVDVQLNKPAKRPISIELLVDKQSFYKFSSIDKDKKLHWESEVLYMHPESLMIFILREKHSLSYKTEICRFSVQGGAALKVASEGNGQPEVLIVEAAKARLSLAFSVDGIYEEAVKGSTTRAMEMLQKKKEVMDKLSVVREFVENILTFVGPLSESFSIAKAVLSTVEMAFQKIRDQKECDDLLFDLLDGMTHLLPVITAVQDITKLEQTKGIINDMLKSIEQASEFTSHYVTELFIKKLLVPTARQEVDGLIAHFKQLKEDYDRSMSREILQSVLTSEEQIWLQKLPQAPHANFDPARICMEGTRQKIISQILDWTHISAQKQIFWLSGLAGAGKSSIASTVAQKLHQEKLLGGCFFCKRDDPVLRDPTRILPTLASRFAQIHRPYAKLLVDILKQDNGVGQQAIQLQFDGLFKGPVEQLQMSKSLASQSPVVFVLDALDECGEVASRRQILTCFLKLQKLVPWIKVFLTSRPTEDISRTFSQASSQAFVFHFPLHEDDAQEDIFLYSQKWIEKMTIEERLPAVWRNNDRTRQLSTKATGLFIWIVTAVTYVEEAVVPEDRLKKLISGSGKGGQTEAELDRLYTLILTDNMGTEDDNRFYFHAVLGTIISVALYRPLPGNALSPLLPSECPDVAIKQVFNRLQSVLYQDGKNQDAIRVCHPSFMDYLTTKDRCSGLGFWIDLHTEDASRALRCLENVCNGVKFNICDIKSSYVMNDEMPVLDLKIKQRIPLVLQYSSLYWTKHLSGALFGTEQIPMVQASLEALLPKTKLLYWLEIVSLTKEIPSLISALPLVVISLKTLKLETLSSMARDVYRFVHAFSKPISDSTAHIYISALVWAPKQSSLAAMLTKQFPNIVTIKHGQEINWPLSLLSIKAKSALDCLAFSPNGQQIASGSKDGDVCIWDSRTGAALFQPLASHSDWVTCIAYSPDGQVIASGSKDKTVCIWSAKTGESILEPLTGHRRQITALAYSLDGNLLVSASEDATLRVWDAWNGQLMCKPLSQHELAVTSVAFSPDNLHFASGSRDETVIIWNSKKGAPLFSEPLKGHTDAVTSAVYSPDGRLLATGSEDKSIIIWDIATGKAKCNPITGHTGWVTSVAFSHDGKSIASGARDGTIRVWDSETGLPVTEPLVGHTSYITAISYAPLGQQIASASVDQTIRIWDIGDNAKLPVKNQPLMARHTEEITAVAFSDRGDLIVSGSKDTTVRVWDVETGTAKCEAFDGHTNIVKCVAFSPTGSYVASGSDDKTIMIWDLTTKKPVCQPLEHNGFVVSVVYSPNGEFMVSCTPMNTIYVWDVVGKQPVVKSLLDHEGVSCLAVSFDGKQLASGSSLGDVRIWNVDECEVIHRIPEHTDSVKSVGFSSDPLDRQVMSCSDDKSVFIWDSTTGALVHKIDAAEGCHGITKGSFSPDGKTVAFGPHFRAQLQWSNPSDFPLSLWDVASGTMHMFLGHEQLIRSVVYSKDGARLVTCSDDKTIRVWETAALREQTQTHTQELHVGAKKLQNPVSSDGWVRTPEGGLLLWVPPEYRHGVYDKSVMTIPTNALNHSVVLDCTRFVHGEAWVDVVKKD